MRKIEIVETDLEFDENRLDYRDETNRIIIHHTGSGADNDMDASAEQIHGWHCKKGWAGIGYHYVVRKDGTVERGRPLDCIGAHAEGANYDSIGIHLSGDFTHVEPTGEQIESTALLIANLCEEFDIPTDREHILGHREVGQSSCPGDRLYAKLDLISGKANYYRYGPPKAEEPAAEKKKGVAGVRIVKGIDVSENNGRVDWKAVADSGFEFAIVRSSFGRCEADSRFIENVEGAHAAGLKCGAYHYGYALTPEQAVEEAKNCIDVIDMAGVLLEMPVWYDMEDADKYKAKHNFDFSIRNCTDICKAFLEHIKPLDCGIYASFDWLENLIDWESLGCPVWNAQWSNRDDIRGYMWQYTDNEWIGGKPFDANIYYQPE